MQEERFTLLAGLYLSGEASAEEKQELDQLLLQHPEWEPRLTALRRIWHAHPQALVKKEDAYLRHLQRLNTQLDVQTAPGHLDLMPADIPAVPMRSANPRRWIWIAATAAVAAMAAAFFFYPHKPIGVRTPIAKTFTTNPGSRSRLTLPDGSKVMLNADSKLTYNDNFSEREVHLSGEAYFDVAKDAGHPFLIHTNVLDIKVLGTTFNVRSYDNEKTTEADLIQGAVEVTLHNKPDKKIILKPNEKITVHNDQVSITTGQSAPSEDDNNDAPLMTVGKVHFQKKDSSVTETLWTKNLLAFDNASLEDVALELQRWYGVSVVIDDPRLKSIRLNAVFGQETLPQVMEALGIAGNFTYVIRKNEVLIGSK